MRKEEQEADGIEVTWGKSDRSVHPVDHYGMIIILRFQRINSASILSQSTTLDWEISRMSSKSDRYAENVAVCVIDSSCLPLCSSFHSKTKSTMTI